jgi:dipeptidyl aminopeptidase/acylaminoacyl peptidase
MWGEGLTDVYVVDPATGTRKMIIQGLDGQTQMSTGGKYVAIFANQEWSAYNLATGKTVDLTSALKNVHFENETSSTPDTPGPWGIAGWTKDDKAVLIYDRFDIWEIDPLGLKPAVNVTDSVGQRERLQFRVVNVGRDADERGIDPTKPIWLRAFDEDTKESGYYKEALGTVKAPEKVIFGPYAYNGLQKAKDAEEYMYTRSTAVEFPNLWVGPALTNVQKISDANPWQKDYNWVTAEQVTWTSNDGVQLQGILYKPENFDPSKKYPMVAYFYEDLSDGLFNYVAPTGRNVINPTHYASNGYLVFEPDIYYKTGHPGMSAYNSIVPGVQSLIAKGFVDPKALGLQGQSWGGYQTAYLITQSNMFAAAMAGAPVANMTSAYGGIRWGTGVNRSMQYEHGQSRIGKNLWDAQALYLENSPLFHLPNVNTPLFIMSNDMDDAVPWWQGIEMFIGLRRLGKEVYMINYNNDVHNPASRANQKDIAMRMQQFFDNKLKGMPAPDWMVHGIPAKDKGKDQVAPPPGIIRP